MPTTTLFPRAIMFHMKELARDTLKATVPILLSALAAGAFTFFQSAATQAGICPTTAATAGETGIIAAAIKAGHTAYHIITYGSLG